MGRRSSEAVFWNLGPRQGVLSGAAAHGQYSSLRPNSPPVLGLISQKTKLAEAIRYARIAELYKIEDEMPHAQRAQHRSASQQS